LHNLEVSPFACVLSSIDRSISELTRSVRGSVPPLFDINAIATSLSWVKVLTFGAFMRAIRTIGIVIIINPEAITSKLVPVLALRLASARVFTEGAKLIVLHVF